MKAEIKLLTIVFITFCIVSSLLLCCLTTTNLNGVVIIQETPNFEFQEKVYWDYYKGFNLKTYDGNSMVLRKAIDRLNITSKDYPRLNYIEYNNINICNAQYFFNEKYIIIYDCGNNVSYRNYLIPQEYFESFALGHELGHHIFERDVEVAKGFDRFDSGRNNFEEHWVDDYAHSLCNCGTKVKNVSWRFG